MTHLFRKFSGLLLLLLATLPACAQGCALCYTQAASAPSRLAEALRTGIFLLIIPPLLISVGIGMITYRKRQQFNTEDVAESN